MYIQYSKTNINGKAYSYPMLCRKYRENGVVKTEVVSNLSKFPSHVVLAIKSALTKSKDALVSLKDILITKSIDYGFVYVLITLMDRLRISEVLEKVVGDRAKLVKLMILGKIVTRGSKLGIYNWIKRNEAIAKRLGIDTETLKLPELYSVLADLPHLQNTIERKWAMYNKQRCKKIYLYDITSSYFEGTENELSAYGYNRDGKKGKKQIVIGLITDSEGFPLKIQVFEGNVNDHTTVIEQLQKLKTAYESEDIIFVGDRGMRIKYNLELMKEEDKKGIGYITALSLEEIRGLIQEGTIQLNLFSKDLVEIEESGNRYILCSNPVLEKEKTQIRASLKNKFEDTLQLIQLCYENRQAKNKTNKEKIKSGKNKNLVTAISEKQLDSYKYRVRKTLEKYHMQSFYQIDIDQENFTVIFLDEKYAQAKLLDGKYVITTNVEKEKLNKEEIREQYKNLKHVEHAFRDMKTMQLDIRPIFHTNEDTTRGHVLVAMFAYTIIREMEIKIFPWLKISNKTNKEQLSFRDIEEELKTIKLNVLQINKNHEEIKITALSEKQKEIFEILKIDTIKL